MKLSPVLPFSVLASVVSAVDLAVHYHEAGDVDLLTFRRNDCKNFNNTIDFALLDTSSEGDHHLLCFLYSEAKCEGDTVAQITTENFGIKIDSAESVQCLRT